MILRDNDCVAVVGGGPAGSFFAHHLLRHAKRLDRRLDVIVVERHRPMSPVATDHPSGGCNFCAGGISPRLNEILDEQGLTVPDEVIQERIEYVWVHGQWKNFRLRVPAHMRMCSVFRGQLPARRGSQAAGFDAFLLGEAIKEGARILHGDVESVAYAASGMPTLTVRAPSGERILIDAGFVVFATGINSHCPLGTDGDPLLASVKGMNPAFAPGKTRQAFIFELDVGEEYLKRTMHREIHFIEYGSKHLALEHTALVPKGRFLTVAMIGRCVDEAVLPRDSRRIMHEFLSLPQINRILPDVEAAPVACACFPRMAVTTARCPFGDRFAVIGDAVGSRLYKDGLFSAHVTASRLAKTILHEGIDAHALASGYGQTVKWLAADNRYGRMVFGASRVAFSMPVISRITYQSFATEFKVRDERNRPLGAVLWKIASGTADYREVLREMCSWRVLGSVLVGAAITLRNVAVETFLDLRWREYGRYPTVVLREKRQAIKQGLASRLGIELGRSPDFERMYVIKIRGAEDEIMEELARFGHRNAPFLNLRFIKVRRIQGEPNEVGSVIRYTLPLVGVRTDLRLTRKLGVGTLLYQLDDRLTDRGILVFDVAPTKDGNRKLSIYSAFDYKRGSHVVSRVLWRAARLVFPGFVHDVVWNHALCTIKEEVERHSG